MVRPVGDVAQVGFSAAARHQVHISRIADHIRARLVSIRAPQLIAVLGLALDNAHAQAQEVINRPHPNRVAASQIVVRGDQMSSLAFQSVGVKGRDGHERLSFTGLHFGDSALVQHHSAKELDVELPHMKQPLADFSDHRKGLGEDFVELFAFGQKRFEFRGRALELFVGHRRDFGFERIDALHQGKERLDVFVARVKHFSQKLNHCVSIQGNVTNLSDPMRGLGTGSTAQTLA